MDINALDETSELLLKVVNQVIDNPDLTLETKEVAKTCAAQAIKLYKIAEELGELSEAQMSHLHNVVDRIFGRWTEI